jgi:hypothetical protein
MVIIRNPCNGFSLFLMTLQNWSEGSPGMRVAWQGFTHSPIVPLLSFTIVQLNLHNLKEYKRWISINICVLIGKNQAHRILLRSLYIYIRYISSSIRMKVYLFFVIMPNFAPAIAMYCYFVWKQAIHSRYRIQWQCLQSSDKINKTRNLKHTNKRSAKRFEK